jgi:hypothetical protein
MPHGKPHGSAAPAAVDYDDAEDPEWVRAVDAVPWTKRGARYEKDVTCPNCGHSMHLVYQTTFTMLPDAAPLAKRDRYSERCQCETAHPPKAAGKGCGRHGRILPP